MQSGRCDFSDIQSAGDVNVVVRVFHMVLWLCCAVTRFDRGTTPLESFLISVESSGEERMCGNGGQSRWQWWKGWNWQTRCRWSREQEESFGARSIGSFRREPNKHAVNLRSSGKNSVRMLHKLRSCSPILDIDCGRYSYVDVEMPDQG